MAYHSSMYQVIMDRNCRDILLREADSAGAVPTGHLTGISQQQTTEHTFVPPQLLLVHRSPSLVEDWCRPNVIPVIHLSTYSYRIQYLREW